MVRIVTFGETMLQYNAKYQGSYMKNGEYLKDCAGAESNVAVNLGKLGITDLETIWVSRLGDDDEGDFILDALAGKTSVVAPKYEGERTGISYLNHHVDGEHVKTYFRKGSAASKLMFEDVSPYIQRCDLLHVTGITPALSDTCSEMMFQTLRYAVSINLPVSFDLNYREQLWEPQLAKLVYEKMIKFAFVFKIGYDEAETVWDLGLNPEEYARFFYDMNGGIIIITLGSEGALAFDGTVVIKQPGFKVRVIDPVGAGDAFISGILGSIAQTSHPEKFFNLSAVGCRELLEQALVVANVCGALTCTSQGDTSGMPTMADVKRFLSRHSV